MIDRLGASVDGRITAAEDRGEAVMAGVGPAITNTVFHATGRGVRDLPIPIDDLL